jgi:hypothetical protein
MRKHLFNYNISFFHVIFCEMFGLYWKHLILFKMGKKILCRTTIKMLRITGIPRLKTLVDSGPEV